MPGRHRPGYHADYQAASRAVLARLRAEQPEVYAQWFAEALAQREAERQAEAGEEVNEND